PDLRNPVLIADVTDVFRASSFQAFATAVAAGAVGPAIPAPGASTQPRSFFDKLGQWARDQGAPGLGYVHLREGSPTGPPWQFLGGDRFGRPVAATAARDGDAVFFVCDKKPVAEKLAGRVRIRLGEELGLIEANAFRFCWVTDFPMYELDEDTKKIEFSHNP